MARTTGRPARGQETRELIVATAERLFAEHGIAAVSNRQVSEAAGQANNFAVGYHFGTKADLVRAIVRRHTRAMERRRVEMLDRADGSTDVRDWVACLVRPATDHLAGLPAPTWYARCVAQADADPALRRVVVDEAIATPSMGRALDGLLRAVTDLPARVHRERADMCRVLIVHMLAERERALHEGAAEPGVTWTTTGGDLVDAIVGLLLAPVTASA